jgi:hypothetical protein
VPPRALILTALVGIASGGAGAVLASSLIRRDAPAAVTAASAAAIPVRSARDGRAVASDRALAAIDQRLRAVEDRQNQPPPRADTSAAGDPLPDAQRAEQQIAAHRAAIEAHDHELRDSGWAATAEARLTASLGQTVGGGQLVRADCRSKTCTAEIAWPSYGAASDGYRSALYDFALNCGRQVVLPPPEHGEGTYHATVVYDCDGALDRGIRAQ